MAELPHSKQDCAICLRPLPGGDALRCGHQFHLQCIAAWVLSRAENSSMCPTCRTDIIDPVESRANQFCGNCSVSLAQSTNTLLYGSQSSNIWCVRCTTTAFVGSIRRRLCDIYADHNPRKLDDIDALLEEWSGEEDQLLSMVEAKYGLVGRLPNIRAEIFSMYTQSNPRKIADIDELMKQWAGEEEHLLANIATKYRRQWEEAVAVIRRRMLTLFSQRAPERVPEIDGLLQKWEGREGHLIAKMVEQHTPSAGRIAAPSIRPVVEQPPTASADHDADDDDSGKAALTPKNTGQHKLSTQLAQEEEPGEKQQQEEGVQEEGASSDARSEDTDHHAEEAAFEAAFQQALSASQSLTQQHEPDHPDDDRGSGDDENEEDAEEAAFEAAFKLARSVSTTTEQQLSVVKQLASATFFSSHASQPEPEPEPEPELEPKVESEALQDEAVPEHVHITALEAFERFMNRGSSSEDEEEDNDDKFEPVPAHDAQYRPKSAGPSRLSIFRADNTTRGADHSRRPQSAPSNRRQNERGRPQSAPAAPAYRTSEFGAEWKLRILAKALGEQQDSASVRAPLPDQLAATPIHGHGEEARYTSSLLHGN